MEPTIGILIHRTRQRISNGRFIRDLIQAGTELGANVYAFAPQDMVRRRRFIRGFTPGRLGRWIQRRRRWPDVVIDFCRVRERTYLRMRRRRDLFLYANQTFTYKWKAMELFSKSEEVQRWIPETRLYSQEQLFDMLAKHPIVYIKPGNGTGGHSVVRVASKEEQYMLHGRRKSGRLAKRELASKSMLAAWLNHWTESERIRTGNFLVQQGLELHLLDNRLVDCRLLIQKNGEGEWEVTGKVLRVGGINSPTTNLLYHGGEALKFHEFLERRFGPERAAAIDRECDELAFQLMKVIERRFGPMMEFGIDIGIDVNGRVWLIEVNPKPSHTTFLHVNEEEVYRKSLRLPMEYAMYLARQGKEDAARIDSANKGSSGD